MWSVGVQNGNNYIKQNNRNVVAMIIVLQDATNYKIKFMKIITNKSRCYFVVIKRCAVRKTMG